MVHASVFARNFQEFLLVDLRLIAYCDHEVACGEIWAESLVDCFAWRVLKSGLYA